MCLLTSNLRILTLLVRVRSLLWIPTQSKSLRADEYSTLQQPLPLTTLHQRARSCKSASAHSHCSVTILPRLYVSTRFSLVRTHTQEQYSNTHMTSVRSSLTVLLTDCLHMVRSLAISPSHRALTYSRTSLTYPLRCRHSLSAPLAVRRQIVHLWRSGVVYSTAL